MKSSVRLAILMCAAIAACGLTGPQTSWAQDDVLVQAAPPQPPRVRKIERVEVNSPYEKRVEILHRPDSMHQIEEWAAKIRDADDEATKAEARKGLAKLLDRYFEEDMERRAEELAKIEERVKKLHALLEKRAAKKQEIIELQIKVLENEADGLGFFNHPHVPGFPGLPMIIKQKMGLGEGGGGGGIFIGSEGVPGAAAGRAVYGSSGAITVDMDAPFAAPTPTKPVRPASPQKPRPGAPPRPAAAPSVGQPPSASADSATPAEELDVEPFDESPSDELFAAPVKESAAGER